MANPTTNFGWQMPTSTDLVTDLPADFEVFGQAVDTSLVDLKGGTTGQVLSKASNTDMDFTWVAQDDSNAIQNAIVDAKGDLITATAADTPARLAVGTNGQTLVADSSTATGLKWAAASSGALTLISTQTAAGSSATLTFNDVFSTTYTNYLIVGNLKESAADTPYIEFRMRVSGTDASGANYDRQRFIGSGSTTLASRDTSNTYGFLGAAGANQGAFTATIYNPFVAAYTSTTSITSYGDAPAVGTMATIHKLSTSYTGITFFNANNNWASGGTISIYGMAK